MNICCNLGATELWDFPIAKMSYQFFHDTMICNAKMDTMFKLLYLC